MEQALQYYAEDATLIYQEGFEMSGTAADILVKNIIGWGVDTVFGLPGDGINGIMEALRTRLAFGFVFKPRTTRFICRIFAAVTISDFLQHAYNAVKEKQ